jgi:hypothetical protein
MEKIVDDGYVVKREDGKRKMEGKTREESGACADAYQIGREA